MRFTTLLMAAALVLIAPTNANALCTTTDAVVALLRDKHGEQLVDWFYADPWVIQLWINPTQQTGSIVRRLPGGMSCLIRTLVEIPWPLIDRVLTIRI